MFINSKYNFPYFLDPTHFVKSTNLHGLLRNYDSGRQMCIFCPLTNNLPHEDSRPIIIPHEYKQPFKIALLENIHNFKINHKLYDLIQISNHQTSAITEEVNITERFNFFGPCFALKT